uniref:Zinc finger BED domain-containing protein RICESLEEPER 2-like n=1 Tax=Nicotiana sylvestris TaxID=4096 RepID=A0A1U7VKW6_NICSY|nr:PREDICTED: zinc finger BED domain-containing protein RICESLEEPER 2-like [Nicotiana sylvestris]
MGSTMNLFGGGSGAGKVTFGGGCLDRRRRRLPVGVGPVLGYGRREAFFFSRVSASSSKKKKREHHKGEDMANGIGRCLREWGINKIFTVTVDNASSNDVTVKELSKQLTKMGTNLMNSTHLHVRCMTHIMNLVVHDGLKETSVSIERVRHAVRYVRQSLARLKRVVEFESAFSHYASSEIGLRYYLEHSYIDVGIPTVAVYLKQLLANEDIILSEMAKNMKEKFDKYWDDPGKMNKIIFITCTGATIQAEVAKYMTSLFSEYVKSSLKGVVLASSSGCSSLGTSTSGLSGSQASTQNIGLLESLMKDIKNYKSGSGGVDTRTELDKYLGEETEDDTKEFDVLLWWKLNSARFPILAEMTRDVLAVPVSSVASECVFRTGGRLLDSFRSSLTPKLVQALVCLQDWLRNEKLKQPISVEEDLDKIEQLEQASNGKDPSAERDLLFEPEMKKLLKISLTGCTRS